MLFEALVIHIKINSNLNKKLPFAAKEANDRTFSERRERK